jgi:Coenzyme PQQ synthesis protein D (PqqD)
MSESRTNTRVPGVLRFLVTTLRRSEVTTVIRISESIRNTHSQDGGVVLDIRHGRMYGLNLVGSRILELLKQDYQEAQIAEEISRQFGISLETATSDVREFLESLDKHGLIERRGVGM